VVLVMKPLLIVLSLISSFLFVPFYSFSENRSPLKVEMIEDIPVLLWYKNYLLKAYSRLGYRLSFIEVQAGRGLIEAKKGNFDALTTRISIIEDQLPNFVRIPIILAQGNLTLYCQVEVPCERSVLDNMENIIGVPTGKNMATSYMKDKTASIYHVISGQKLVEMFDKKRLEYVLTIEAEEFGNYVQPPSITYRKIELQHFEAFHYLNKKHQALVKPLTDELAAAIEELGPVPKGFKH